MSMHRKMMMAAKKMPKKGIELSKAVKGKLNKAAEMTMFSANKKSSKKLK